MKLDPDEPQAHYQLALLYARLKDQQRAQEEMLESRKAEGQGKDPIESQLDPRAPCTQKAWLILNILANSDPLISVVVVTKAVIICSLVVALLSSLQIPLHAQGISAVEKPLVTFEEVPASTSGITWVHNNAHSPIAICRRRWGRVSRSLITTTTAGWISTW